MTSVHDIFLKLIREISKFENSKKGMEELYTDEYFMKQALQQAELAKEKDEVPVGAVIVSQNRVIARAHNLTECLNDVTAHAEMQAFTSAAEYIGGKFLHECILYVTLEPCIMCAGASYWTRLSKVVYGASDPKRGFQRIKTKLLHPKTTFVAGVMEMECSTILTDFFKQKRRESSL
ncbi:MAG: tRNA(adenine34) deaminase [Patiriisocius sp.]